MFRVNKSIEAEVGWVLVATEGGHRGRTANFLRSEEQQNVLQLDCDEAAQPVNYTETH